MDGKKNRQRMEKAIVLLVTIGDRCTWLALYFGRKWERLVEHSHRIHQLGEGAI